jgi:GntR family transcriptional regulator
MPTASRRRKPLTLVDRTLGNPLHRQVFLVLRDSILARRYAEGEALPTEEELVALFKVSRTTIRYALAAADAAGLIERRQGVGTFVRYRGTATPLRTSLSDLNTHIDELTRSTDVELVEFDYVRAPGPVQDFFGSDDDDLFQRAVRLRKLKKRPILHVTSYIPEAIGRRFDAADLERTPLGALLREAGVKVHAGEQRVTAILAEPTVASRLDVDVGSPLLQIERRHFTEAQEPVEYLETLAVPGEFELRMTLSAADLG